nr:LysR family transcriptional regulator ArgP [Motilibacter aurantiacus]
MGQLRALSAVAAEGSLDAASRSLHVTPSAVSQRLKALERAVGSVLVVRSRPVRLTAAGQTLLRLARQVDLLVADAVTELAGLPTAATLPVAVNADSLATWVLPAIAPLAAEGVVVDIVREDQAHTSRLLRDGSVVAAITDDSDTVPGCSVRRLGSMRYRPMAAVAFAERWFPEGLTPSALGAAPVVVFDRRDALQHTFLRRRTRGRARPPMHYVPASADFVSAVALGMGWGMVPELQAAGLAEPLVDLDPRGAVDVPLHWQQWKLSSPALDRLADAVVAAAESSLSQPRARSSARTRGPERR